MIFDTNSLDQVREVLAELAQDKAMDAFRGEYEKLFAALERSHQNEKRLSTRFDDKSYRLIFKLSTFKLRFYSE